jgi:transposase InsO family protein
VLTEEQVEALEKLRERDCGEEEIETHHPGYLLAQDTFYVGVMKGVGRIYLQSVIDTYSKVGFGKLYTSKLPVTAADVLNDRVLPFFEEQGVPVLRILTDRGTEFCGKLESHPYELFLALNDIEHTKTKARSPQTNGICERFHKTVLDEFLRVAFRKKLYTDLESLQRDLDEFLVKYNTERPNRGKHCEGRTPMETFEAGKEVVREKMIA